MAKEKGEVMCILYHLMRPQDLQTEQWAPEACVVIPVGAGTRCPLHKDDINIGSSELGEEIAPSHIIKSG